MPHKRKKASERKATRSKNGFNNPPSSSAADGLSKNMYRILNAEKIVREQRERKRKEAQASSSKCHTLTKGEGLKIRADESLKKFSRRAEAELRPELNAAFRKAASLNKSSSNPIQKKRKRSNAQEAEVLVNVPSVDQRIAEKRAKTSAFNNAEDDKLEFAGRAKRYSVNDVAEAPPSLARLQAKLATPSKAQTKSAKVPLSLAEQEAIEKERKAAIERYRKLKEDKLASQTS